MIGLIVTNAIGQSMNMLSLLGALIALGMLVDEAIVVAENIYRHLEEGKSRREAAILGTVEMFPAVLTATLTTIFAFLPLLMLTGEMGTFIKILPIMISVLLISSLFEAFFFLPLHSYDFLRLRKEDHMAHAIWDTLNSWHNSVLHFLFKRRILSLIVIFTSIIMATGMMMKSSKFQLFPDFDVTQIYITGKVNINNDLQDSEKIVTNVEKIILSKLSSEEYSSVTSVIGMRLDAKNEAELGDNLFHIFVDLHERAPDNFFNKYINPHFALEYDASILKRERTAHAISMDLEKWLKEVSEQSYHDRNFKEQKLFEEFQITVPGTGIVAHDIEISLGGQRGDVMVAGIKKLETSLSTIAGVDNISDDLEIGEEELKLRINSYGQQLGFTEASLTKELRAYYLKGEYGKLFNTQGLIRVRIEGNAKDSFSSIESFQVHIPNTKQYIALKEVCHFIVSKSYVSIKKEDSKRLRTVFASLDKKLSTSAEVMKALQPTIDALDASGYIVHVKGEQQENEKTQREMMQAGIIAILLIFITLVWLFNSIVKTLIVLSTIPLVLLGVYIGHWIMGLNLTMPGLIGVIGLAGVVVNDGLIMVSFISKAKDSEDLMRLAKTRLRPILLTSITTVLGLSTLIFFASGQAQILQPMAISLGFGITWATVLNLVYIPLLYSVVYRVKR
jgi:multidrug efflux pump subunit AcrB